MRTDEQILQELGKRIRHAREKKDWTQADLASEMSTSTGQISLLETGKREPGILMLRRLNRALGLQIIDLLNE